MESNRGMESIMINHNTTVIILVIISVLIIISNISASVTKAVNMIDAWTLLTGKLVSSYLSY